MRVVATSTELRSACHRVLDGQHSVGHLQIQACAVAVHLEVGNLEKCAARVTERSMRTRSLK